MQSSRIARRDKKDFLNEQCKEIEENNRKDWTFLWEIGDIKDISCKDGHNKGQKWLGPDQSTRDEEKWQQHTEEIYKKGLNDLDNHNGVVTHLEPDIWSVKSSGP